MPAVVAEKVFLFPLGILKAAAVFHLEITVLALFVAFAELILL